MSSSPAAPAHAQLVERPPVLKIDQHQEYTYGYSAHSSGNAATASSSVTRTVSAPVRSFSFSQGGRCHCCGGIFVISNRCSNRECDHVQCAQCY